MKSHRPPARRIAVYFFAGTLPPIMVGIVLTFLILKDLLLPPVPTALPDTVAAAAPGVPQALKGQATALIALSPNGVQTSEVLISAAVLAESGLYRVVTATRERALVRSSAGLELYPHTTFAEAPAADLLVVPSWMGPADPLELDAIKARAEAAKVVLALGDGARVLAQAGLLEGKKATAHFAGRESLEQTYPRTQWQWDAAVVRDGKWITSGGVFLSAPAALEAVAARAGFAQAAEVAARVDWPETATAATHADAIRWADWIPMLLHGGFAWDRTNVGISLFEGVPELALAAYADPLPRSLGVRTVFTAPQRTLIKTQHGLLVVPNIPDAKAPHLDETFKADGLGLSQSITRSLTWLDHNQSPAITRFVARMTRYPWDGGPAISGLMPHLLFRVAFVSLVALSITWLVERRAKARRTRAVPQ